MRIAITGATGLVGAAVARLLRARGDEIVPLSRDRQPPPGSARWNPATGEVDTTALGAVDGVVHLAGDNVASGRWSAAKKQKIRDSRVPATERLCQALAGLASPPRVLVSASATGIYGDRGDEELDESSAPGDGFLADIVRDWEAATAPAAAAGIRVVMLRIGLVLTPHGGALQRMLPAFRLGVGGRLGSGRQWVSWISLEDLAAAIAFALDREALRGPVLGTAPQPVTNREFTRALGAALRRPTLLPAPAFALRLAFGEMATALMLSSQRARPRALLAAGFGFRHPQLGPTLPLLLRPESQARPDYGSA